MVLLYIYSSLFLMPSYFQGIPESAEIAVPGAHYPASQANEAGAAPPAPASGAPNTSPLNLFPQVNFIFLVCLDNLGFGRTIVSQSKLFCRKHSQVLVVVDLEHSIFFETINRYRYC